MVKPLKMMVCIEILLYNDELDPVKIGWVIEV
jgi:hypothetical protein